MHTSNSFTSNTFTSNTFKTVVLLSGLGIVGASYWSSDKLAVKAARAREVAPVLDRTEVRGVVAHEVAHIRNRDILIGSIAAAVATAISAIANMVMFAGLFGGNNDDDGPHPAVVLLLAVLTPIAAGVMQMALSRSREFEADRIGAIVNPLTGRQASFAKLFMTHPPMEDRIARLLGVRQQVTA